MVETTIPYTLALITNEEADSGEYEIWQSGSTLYYYQAEDGGVLQRGCRESGDNVFMRLNVSPSAWDAALPGKYTATINYDVAYIVP